MDTIEAYLIKQEHLAAAQDLMESNSEDYQLGFEMGVEWLASYCNTIMELYFKEVQDVFGKDRR